MFQRARKLGYSCEDAEDIASECVRMRLARWGKAHQTNVQTFTDACRSEGHVQRTETGGAYLDRHAVHLDDSEWLRFTYRPSLEAALDILWGRCTIQFPNDNTA
jgi:hypothetical protein